MFPLLLLLIMLLLDRLDERGRGCDDGIRVRLGVFRWEEDKGNFDVVTHGESSNHELSLECMRIREMVSAHLS